MSLYRARFDDGFDTTEPSQFSYNHNINNIKRFRYNKDFEAVLYTSTFPSAAYQEIDDRRKRETHFFLSVWTHRIGTRNLNCALNVDGYNVQVGSTAEEFYNILCHRIGKGTSKLKYLMTLGSILEKSDSNYIFSSTVASKLFEKHDALITTSIKSQGSQLNITFNKFATDNLLDLKYIYYCKVPNNCQVLAYEVDEIGFPKGDIIKWYKWKIDLSSIVFSKAPNSTISIEELRSAIINTDISSICMFPNVNKRPSDLHNGIVIYKNVTFRVDFRIILI